MLDLFEAIVGGLSQINNPERNHSPTNTFWIVDLRVITFFLRKSKSDSWKASSRSVVGIIVLLFCIPAYYSSGVYWSVSSVFAWGSHALPSSVHTSSSSDPLKVSHLGKFPGSGGR